MNVNLFMVSAIANNAAVYILVCLHVNIGVGKSQEIVENAFKILILLNCSLKSLYQLTIALTYHPANGAQEGFLRRSLFEGRPTGVGKGTKNVFCYSLALQQSLVGAILGVLGADSTDQESTVVFFSEGTSVRSCVYFWQLSDMLPAFPGDSWLPSTMTHLWLNI